MGAMVMFEGNKCKFHNPFIYCGPGSSTHYFLFGIRPPWNRIFIQPSWIFKLFKSLLLPPLH